MMLQSPMLLLSRTALVVMSLATGLGVNCEQPASGTPVKVHAYERQVIGGIPGGAPGRGGPASSEQLQYLIYLETPPDAAITVDGVWIKGTYYSVETAHRNTPIRFESPVALADDRGIAVPATKNAVIEVTPKTPMADK